MFFYLSYDLNFRYKEGFMNKTLDVIALTIGIIGAINWGLIGFFNFNLVQFLLGNGGFTRIIYGLVGLCGLYLLTFYMKTGYCLSESNSR